jgi:hypothetical protein
MSTTLYVATDRDLAGVEINRDRVLLADLVADHVGMGAICSKLGVMSLSDFQSYDPEMAASLIEDEEAKKAAIAKAQPITWFSPGDAIPTIRALFLHYREGRFVQEREGAPVDRTEDLLKELNDLEFVLGQLGNAGGKFRLFIGS